VAPRANWKGFLKIAELSCAVALYTAASQSDRIAFHTLNRATGHRLRRQFVDQESGDPVEADQQVKGYEVGQGEYVLLEPDEIAAAMPQSDKTLAIEQFVASDDIDDVFFDKPYYLAPSDATAVEAFTLMREGMRRTQVAALARAVLFRRVRTLLIRPLGDGLMATTLHFDYEVRSADEAFSGIPELKIEGEMLDLAKHIIETKRGTFDPSAFHDRYEAALAELVKAKFEGRPLPKPERPAPTTKVTDLLSALRRSAAASDKPSDARGDRTSRTATPKRPKTAAKESVAKAETGASERTPQPSHRRKAS
jgi:DNA end-binding protein Ku